MKLSLRNTPVETLRQSSTNQPQSHQQRPLDNSSKKLFKLFKRIKMKQRKRSVKEWNIGKERNYFYNGAYALNLIIFTFISNNHLNRIYHSVR